MSMSFWTDNDKEGFNLCNRNALDLLLWLGYAPEWSGNLDPKDLEARCRRKLWPEAINTDVELPTVEQGHVIDCGRPEGYLKLRTEWLLNLATKAVGFIHFG